MADEKKKVSEKPIDGNKKVSLELFRDSKDYKNDVFVAVNGESCVIARGKKVPVKKKFANVIRNSNIQDEKTAKLMDAKSDEFKSELRARNL